MHNRHMKTDPRSGSSVGQRRRTRPDRGETVEPSSVTTSEAIREFDAVLARMQTPDVRRGMKAAFAASGKQLGKAAVAAASRRSKRSE
jgi:hypothetical protein